MSGTIGNVIVAGVNIALYIDNTDVGFTHDGVTIEKPMEHYDIEADQSIAILGKRKIKERCKVSTNIEEATLANIKIAIDSGNSVTQGGGWSRLSFGDDDTCTEHVLRFEGKAPGTNKTRKLNIYKAVSVEPGGMAYKKGDKTLIPVVFEAVADTTKPARQRYGYYEDQE